MSKKENLTRLTTSLFSSSFGNNKPYEDIEYLLENLKQETLLQEYQTFCDKVSESNKKRLEVVENNKKIKEDLLSFVQNHELVDRISLSHQWKKTNGNLYAHWEKVIKDLQRYVPPHRSAPKSLESQFKFEFIYNSETHWCYTTLATFLSDVSTKVKQVNRTLQANNIMYVKALEYVSKHQLDDSWCVTTKDYVSLCNEHSKEAYRESVFANGETIEVQHSDGDDCEWNGDHRCECGNNRYYLEIEGNFVEGWYSWGQWC